MMHHIITTILYGLLLLTVTLVNSQKTKIDSPELQSFLRIARTQLFEFVGNSGDNEKIFKYNLKKGRIQRQFKDNEKFFCDVNGPGRRSKEPPTSVHKLRPGDIDIVGALGDSLTSGNGAMARTILQVTTENKGVSWSIGGQSTWRKFLTIPNILKEFNQNLYGYSLSDGLSYQKISRFNVAELGAMSIDTPFMAKVLVTRMVNDPLVDIKKHWKLITLMIGPNDFCSDVCYHKSPEKMIDLWEKDLIAVINTLKTSLPRTMLNVVLPPNIKILLKFRGKPNECETLHRFECPCFFTLRFQHLRKRLIKIIETWKKRLEGIVNREEYQNSTEFVANVQKFSKNLQMPILNGKNNLTDFSYLSLDCFHFSQKGYARATNAYWNNMLEPVGNKTLTWNHEFDEVKCPTEKRPYLATKLNSS